MFLGVGVGLVSFGGVLRRLLLMFQIVGSLPKLFEKILLMSGLPFWVRSLFLRFFADVVCFCLFCFLRDKDQVVAGHPHTHLFCCSGSRFCPAALVFLPLLGVFFGLPFWAPPVFGILLELMGLELARPFRGGVSVLLLPGFFFPFSFAAARFF